MAIHSAQFYWVTCDAPDCEARCPDPKDETIAWSDQESAVESAEDSDWKEVDIRGFPGGLSDTRHHYCPDHAINVCGQCGVYDSTPNAGEREYLCTFHYYISFKEGAV